MAIVFAANSILALGLVAASANFGDLSSGAMVPAHVGRVMQLYGTGTATVMSAGLPASGTMQIRVLTDQSNYDVAFPSMTGNLHFRVGNWAFKRNTGPSGWGIYHADGAGGGFSLRGAMPVQASITGQGAVLHIQYTPTTCRVYTNGDLIANITVPPAGVVAIPTAVLGQFNNYPFYVSELVIFDTPDEVRYHPVKAVVHTATLGTGLTGDPADLKNRTSSGLSGETLPAYFNVTLAPENAVAPPVSVGSVATAFQVVAGSTAAGITQLNVDPPAGQGSLVSMSLPTVAAPRGAVVAGAVTGQTTLAFA